MPSLQAQIRIDSENDLTPWVWQGTDKLMLISQATCAVDTGAMRDSHGVEFTGRNHGTITVGMDYSSFVEFGTRFMAAQPFLGPAISAGLPLLMRDLARKEALLRAGRTPSDELHYLSDEAVGDIIERIQAANARRELLGQDG